MEKIACLFNLLFPALASAAELLSPTTLLGFEPGERPARLEELRRYFEHLAAACPYARLESYGRSYEGRELYVLVISSQENIGRLDEFEKDLHRLADPRATSPKEASRIAEGTPAVAWLAFSIHGDELSGSDAALWLAWRLCAGESDQERLLRRELLVFIDPVENPDGRARTLAQLELLRGRVPNPDPASIQHTGLWPWGRWNHYGFDPNRDYLGLVHPETRGRVRAWLRWTPQLVLDAHEMWGDSTFLFSPPRDPFNPHVPPHVSAWLERFAWENAQRFDLRGYSYYTGAWNEEFYVAYGSAWPKYFGAIGILHEQAGSDGGPLRQRTGRTLSYRRTVEQQLEAALANLETLARHRREILEDFADGRRAALERGRLGPQRAYLIAPGKDIGRASRLVSTLLRHGLEVQVSVGPLEAEALHSPWSGQPEKKKLEPFAWMVRVDQPLQPLLRNLLDFHQPLGRESLREERRWLENRGHGRLYETTAWSLPLSFGVDVWWTEKIPAAEWRNIEQVALPRPALPTSARYGYLLDGVSDNSLAALAALLGEGFTVRVGSEPFRFAGRDFPRGALLLRREENPGPLDERVRALAQKWRTEILALDTAKTEKGADFGSDEFRPLREPRVAVFAGFPVAPSPFGEVWHLLDWRLGMRMSMLELWTPRQVDLGRYNVLILPPAYGGSEALEAGLGKESREALLAWVKGGGTLIVIGNAAEYLAEKDRGLSGVRPRRQMLEKYPPVVLGLGPEQAIDCGPLLARGLLPTPEAKKKAPPAEPEPLFADCFDVPPVVGESARFYLADAHPVFKFPRRFISLVEWVKATLPPGKDENLLPLVEEADRRLRRLQNTGAMLAIELDEENWLAWGCPKQMAVHFERDEVLVAEPPAQVAARFAAAEKLHLSGLLWPEGAGRIARTAYLVREKVGRGQVILFADDPLYRATAWASQRLFLNALLWGPGLGTDWSAPW